MAVLDQTTAISNAHLAMSQKVNEQVIKVLDEFVKVKEAEKKKLQADGAKVEQALHAELSSAKKAKEAYESAGKAAAAAHDAHTKAMTAAGR
jgi:bacterioferritin (cytochrome b1)